MYNMRHTSPIVLIHDHHGGRRHTTAAIVPHSRLNLASLAVSSTVSAWGVDSADTATLKQEISFKFAHE